MSDSSNSETQAIAPEDYEHVFHNESIKEKSGEAVKEKEMTYTQLIAPSDYEHIYQGERSVQKLSKDQLTKKKDVATVQLTAPSDYHISAGSKPNRPKTSMASKSTATNSKSQTSLTSTTTQSKSTAKVEEPTGKKYRYSSTKLTRLTQIEIRRVLDSFVSDNVYYPDNFSM